jgi:hypothetical protein
VGGVCLLSGHFSRYCIIKTFCWVGGSPLLGGNSLLGGWFVFFLAGEENKYFLGKEAGIFD